MKHTELLDVLIIFYFTKYAKCVKDLSIGLSIEPYAFDLFALEEINKNAENNHFLVTSGYESF